jgi:hypothetical protein
VTAEVAILNKSAVALAADSVVTIQKGGDRKTYNSVNKLFALSKYHPVGVMVYGNSEFMEVPWELIVKLYRKKLGEKSFGRIQDYADDFLKFIRENERLFSKEARQDFIRNLAFSIFHHVARVVRDAAKEQIESSGSITDAELPALVEGALNDAFELLDQTTDRSPLDEKALQLALTKHSDDIEDALKAAFQQLPITGIQKKRALDLCSFFARKNAPSALVTGVVIAGFGEDEDYPALVAYELDGLADKWLRMNIDRESRVGVSFMGDTTDASAIFPFAQQDVVTGFVEGIVPKQDQALWGFLRGIFTEYPRLVTEALPPSVNPADKAAFAEHCEALGVKVLESFSQARAAYTRTQFVSPMLDAVEVLPKDELAAMAEALVNLTSFKRKMELSIETVGEPIDVAVISKGDGLIWVKRKHYFKAEQNPQFLANYYRA